MAMHALNFARLSSVSSLGRCRSRPASKPQRAQFPTLQAARQRHSIRVLATGETLDTQPPSNVEEQENSPDLFPEETLFEGNGAPAELVISMLLAGTILYIPLTIGAIGRRLWIKYRFTNKRMSIINTSPLFSNQVDISYKMVKEVKAVSRCFGLWGDMVFFLKDGRQIELTAVEDFRDVKTAVQSFIAQRP